MSKRSIASAEIKPLLNATGSRPSEVEGPFDARKVIRFTHTSELVIALCGPIGSPLHSVAETLQSMLVKDFGYAKCERIRLSRFIEEHAKGKYSKGKHQTEFERIKDLISIGDEMRKNYGPRVLAELAIARIAEDRNENKLTTKAESYQPRRVCHIIDSIKNQQELDILKLVYRDMLYTIGVFSPPSVRVSALQKKGMSQHQVYQLIDQDSGEEKDHGQTVEETFPQSDFFIRIDSATDTKIRNKVDRFLNLVLSAQVLTPWASETAMYQAASAAGNSACLSRQVGAALTDSAGEVLAVGWNDVPKAGGNLYAASNDASASEHDMRCWNLEGGVCFNDREKRLTAELLATDLVNEKVISPEQKSQCVNIILTKSKVKNLIEFSRAVHAEMHAIIQGSQLAGERVKGGKLFCTTYPCHSCARHIVAAGIMDVYYIEPYRKSLAKKLHDDAISENEADIGKVRILPYEGVAPNRYLKLFRVAPNSRKSDGKLVPVELRTTSPAFEITMEALPTLEGVIVNGLIRNGLLYSPEAGIKAPPQKELTNEVPG